MLHETIRNDDFFFSNGHKKISDLYFNTVKNSSGFLLHIKYNYITIFNNNKYISKESLKNTTQNYIKLYLFSTNAMYLT